MQGELTGGHLEAREQRAEQRVETAEPVGVSSGAEPTGSALTLIAAIKPACIDALEELLTSIGQDVRNNPHLPADKLSTVHFFRWVILRRAVGTSRDYLAFESNYDGTLDAHLDDLCRVGGEGLQQIYAHCEGFPPAGNPAGDDPAALRAFMKRHIAEHSTFYRANPHKRASRIKLEAEVREQIEAFVDAHRTALVALRPKAIYDRIREHLKQGGTLAKLAESAPARPASEPLKTILLGQWPTLLPILFLLPVLLPILIIKELTDKQWDPPSKQDDPSRVPTLKQFEDRVVQNQLSHVIELKPGPFRRFVLARVLGAIDLLAERHFNQGALGGISTIHFARWVKLDDRFLLFFSNYDGSWENYLGDFIDLAAIGLTSIWSNTRGFPRTSFLVGKGARDEERFKAWTRAHQVPSQVWYSAYPELSVKNTLANARIAEGLVHPPTDEAAAEQWLKLL